MAKPQPLGVWLHGQHLQALAAQAKVTTGDVFALLARYGRDAAGAAPSVAGRPPTSSKSRIAASPGWSPWRPPACAWPEPSVSPPSM
jgi:hypothetical protein